MYFINTNCQSTRFFNVHYWNIWKRLVKEWWWIYTDSPSINPKNCLSQRTLEFLPITLSPLYLYYRKQHRCSGSQYQSRHFRSPFSNYSDYSDMYGAGGRFKAFCLENVDCCLITWEVKGRDRKKNKKTNHDFHLMCLDDTVIGIQWPLEVTCW